MVVYLDKYKEYYFHNLTLIYERGRVSSTHEDIKLLCLNIRKIYTHNYNIDKNKELYGIYDTTR